ncbi:MAG TPA: ribonuclease HII [Herpetosiphonaceae bacterium]
MMPTVEEEYNLRAQGYRAIAGIDEAGRGCWAGPVVAAAVVLGPAVLDRPELLDGVNDSKQLRPAQRATLEQTIYRHVLGVGVGVVPAYLIDAFGIVEATRLAMETAILHLPLMPDALLIDALTLPRCPLPQRAIIRGDSTSLSIAAASVIAKTARDRLMTNFDRLYPAFQFGAHKGYGTAVHAQAIAEHGATTLHRRSFRPLWHITEYKEHRDAA